MLEYISVTCRLSFLVFKNSGKRVINHTIFDEVCADVLTADSSLMTALLIPGEVQWNTGTHIIRPLHCIYFSRRFILALRNFGCHNDGCFPRLIVSVYVFREKLC